MAMVKSLFSISTLAVELGKDRRTMASALSGVPPDGTTKQGHRAWHLITALQALGWTGRKVRDGERLDPEQERARKDKAIAALHELKLAILRKEYVRAEGITRVVIAVF